MTRLLVAFVLLGAVSVSFADHMPHEPVTPVGQAIAEAFEGLASGTWSTFMGYYDDETAPVSPIAIPVSFTASGVNYAGSIEVYDPAQFLSSIMADYYSQHDTLGCEDGPDYPISGYSLDWFYYYQTCNGPVWTFQYVGVWNGNGVPSTPLVPEYSCWATAATGYSFATGSYERTQLPNTGMRYFHGEAAYGATITGHGSGQTSPGSVLGEFGVYAHINSLCGMYEGELTEWQLGEYVGQGEPPVPHPDTIEGLVYLAVQNVADLERVLGYAQLPAGMQWNPEPSSEVFGPCYPNGCAEPGNTDTDGDGINDADDPCPLNPNPTCGTGGGDPTDPPTDPETQCGIIDIPCNLRWLFVPKTPLSQHWERVKTTAETRFPFNFATGFLSDVRPGVGDSGEIREDIWFIDEESLAACEVQTINFASVPGTFLGEALDGEGPAYNLCDNAYAEWIHTYLRPFLLFLAIWAMGWSVFNMVTRA